MRLLEERKKLFAEYRHRRLLCTNLRKKRNEVLCKTRLTWVSKALERKWEKRALPDQVFGPY